MQIMIIGDVYTVYLSFYTLEKACILAAAHFYETR